MTKSEAKKGIQAILEKVAELSDAMEDLVTESDDTYNEIEPYEGRNELTTEQEERQEWFSELSDTLNEVARALEIIDDELNEMIY